MSAVLQHPASHPVTSCVQTLDTALSEAAAVDVSLMSPADRQAALLHVVRLESRLAALRLRLMSTCDDVAQDEGARDVAALLTHLARTDGTADRRDLALATSLTRWEAVATALRDGDLNLAQARVIVRSLEALPRDDLSVDVLAEAETHLVAEAARFGPRELRLLGRRMLEVVAPDVAEAHEAALLSTEERQAWRRTSLVSGRRGDGTTRFVLTVPDAVATRLHTYLEAFTSPRQRGAGEGERVPVDVRRGQAFCALLETWDPRRLPLHGGDATTLVVTVPLASLRDDLGRGDLGAAEALSPGEVRRLACTADLLPAVLGGTSEVLDLGRSARLFSPAQRKALAVRDRKCRAEGCTIPAPWCEAHHAGTPWSRGGRTDLADGVLLCSWHHHRAHDPTYETSRAVGGDVRFVRRRQPGGSPRRDTR